MTVTVSGISGRPLAIDAYETFGLILEYPQPRRDYDIGVYVYTGRRYHEQFLPSRDRLQKTFAAGYHPDVNEIFYAHQRATLEILYLLEHFQADRDEDRLYDLLAATLPQYFRKLVFQ